MSSKKTRKKTGAGAFHDYYGALYGSKWASLTEAMMNEPVYHRLEEGLRKPYFMDEASLYPARALNVRPGDSVLDMCAAPGGKSLILAQALNGKGSLVSNDRSNARRGRLKKVMDDHLNKTMRSVVTVTGHDATKWNLHEREAYDRILLDAPCSSERHWLHAEQYMKDWTAGRSRNLAVKQFSMLAAALDALKPGGTLVYSTCALSFNENDGVMQKLLKKRKDRFRFDIPQTEEGKKTEFGIHILPNSVRPLGPIYFSRIIKNS